MTNTVTESEIRTSLTHPLQIAEIAVLGGGSLGLTFCPGKKQPRAMTGAWCRDLALDMDKINAWGASVVCTLMEQDELHAYKVPDIGSFVTERGMAWFHMPIVDRNVPDRQFEMFWAYYGLRLRQILRSGGKVLLHCLGGLGRTGSIAARLLIELGMHPEDAITSVRRARPGAIENCRQEKYVRSIKPLSHRLDDKCDRLLGCLIGGAIGDAFGYGIEFDSLSEIREQHGPAGLTEPLQDGRGRIIVSDDTQMTLFTLEGMIRAMREAGSADFCNSKRVVEHVRQAYLDWLGTQIATKHDRDPVGWLALQKAMRVRRAPGNTCLSALCNGGHGTIDAPINNSKGCGAAMRSAPLGFAAMFMDHAAGFGDRERLSSGDRPGLERDHKALNHQLCISKVAADVGALTHSHPDGWGSAVMVACIISHLTNGATLYDAANIAINDLDLVDKAGVTVRDIYRRAIELAQRNPNDPAKTIKKLGEGWVGEEAVAIAIYAALSQKTFNDAIICAANHDGDSDSTASIAGQFWGAEHGIKDIPDSWILKLDVLPEILTLIASATAIEFTA